MALPSAIGHAATNANTQKFAANGKRSQVSELSQFGTELWPFRPTSNAVGEYDWIDLDEFDGESAAFNECDS